jgi:hypothetical protein
VSRRVNSTVSVILAGRRDSLVRWTKGDEAVHANPKSIIVGLRTLARSLFAGLQKVTT